MCKNNTKHRRVSKETQESFFLVSYFLVHVEIFFLAVWVVLAVTCNEVERKLEFSSDRPTAFLLPLDGPACNDWAYAELLEQLGEKQVNTS